MGGGGDNSLFCVLKSSEKIGARSMLIQGVSKKCLKSKIAFKLGILQDFE